MKHNHKWQFKKERKKLVKILKPKSLFWVLSPFYSLMIIEIYDYYNVFACECGAEKEVLIR